MAGYVHDFTDEIEAGDFVSLHRLGGKLVGVHASRSDFSFDVAVGGFWSDRPVVCLPLEFRESVIGPGCRRMQMSQRSANR